MRLCTFCVLNSLDAETGDRRHLVNVLVLVLHGRAHGRVSPSRSDRKQVFGCTIHLRSEAVSRAVDDQILRQSHRVSGLFKLLVDGG